MRISLVSFWYVSSIVSYVNGYFGHTHRFLGKSLAKNLNDTPSKQFVERYVGINNLDKISTWADTIKRKPEFRWTQTLHYIDVEMCMRPVSRKDIVSSCHNNCIYTAILNMTNELRCNQKFLTRDQTITDIKLLIHFLQDMFQPMHTYGGHHTRGGNDWKIIVIFPDGKKKATNMHTLWDSILPEYYIKHFHPLVTASVHRRQFSDIFQFEEYLKNTISKVLSVACRKIDTIISNNTVIFDDYFEPEVFKFLFQHYINFAIDTLAFITETKN